jgi:hypothetical protein
VLLNAGANVHARNDEALRMASYNGHTDVVKLLLDAGADVHANNDLALRYAIEKKRADVVKVLKDHMAKEKKNKVKESLNEKFTDDDSDPIHDMGIGIMNQIDKFMNEIFRDGAQYSLSDKLFRSVIFNKDEFVQYLITKVPVENQVFSFNIAVKSGKLNYIKLFINNGIMEHFNYYTKYDWNNPFLKAAYHAKANVLKYFFEDAKKKNIKINQIILDQCLEKACILVYTNSARVLLDNGAQITEKLAKMVRRWLPKGRKVKVTNMLKEKGILEKII